jgi:hypothetical protein
MLTNFYRFNVLFLIRCFLLNSLARNNKLTSFAAGVCGGKLILIASSFPFLSVCENKRHKELFVEGSYIFNKRKSFPNNHIYFQLTRAHLIA